MNSVSSYVGVLVALATCAIAVTTACGGRLEGSTDAVFDQFW